MNCVRNAILAVVLVIPIGCAGSSPAEEDSRAEPGGSAALPEDATALIVAPDGIEYHGSLVVNLLQSEGLQSLTFTIEATDASHQRSARGAFDISSGAWNALLDGQRVEGTALHPGSPLGFVLDYGPSDALIGTFLVDLSASVADGVLSMELRLDPPGSELEPEVMRVRATPSFTCYLCQSEMVDGNCILMEDPSFASPTCSAIASTFRLRELFP